MKKYTIFFFILLTLKLSAQTLELSPLEYVPGTIYAMSADESTGKIMVGGSFNESADFPFAKFAIMEDEAFTNPGTGLPEDDSEGIMAFAESKGAIYAGSASNDPLWRLAKRNTTNGNWESTISIDGTVYALDTLSDGNLLVLGDFTTPYADAFIYDGENASPLNGFSIEGTPIGVTSFDGKYYINYLSIPQDYKNIFIWDESCECESASETNLPTNFVIYAVGKSEDKLYISLWNFDEGDKQFYESSDGVNFEVIGTMSGEVLGIKSHDELVYFYGAIDEVNDITVNPVVTYNPISSEWKSIGDEIVPGPSRCIDFIGDDLYISLGAWIYVYRAETPVDTTEDTVSISISNIEKNINIYPNPATDFITIEIENVFDLEVSILNSFGQLIRTSAILTSSPKITLDIGDLPPGIYSVKSEKFTGRFVKL